MPAFEVAVICEKGNQAKALRKAYNLTEVKKLGDIGNVYYDKAFKMCVGHLQGHLLELMPPEYYAPSLRRDKEGWNRAALPVIPPGERWKLEPKKDNRPREKAKIKAYLHCLKWALVDNGQPGEIALAVDNDKEGELLGWETLEYFGVVDHPNITRLLFSELSPKATKAAFEKRVAGSIWFPRYLAGLARQYCDWMIGMNVTIALTVDNEEMMPPFSPLNSGRVIFAIAYLLYCRHLAIKNYKPQDYYSERVTFKTDQGVYTGKVIYPEKALDPELKQLTNRSYADKYHDHIIKSGKGQVVRYDQDRKKTSPPVGFHRTGLDRHMIRRFGMDLKDITDALQTLYDSRNLVTYPRVDVKHLDIGMHPDMPDYIAAMSHNLLNAPQIDEKAKSVYRKAFEIADATKKSNIWKKGIAEGEAHHAIIPTSTKANLADLTPNEFLIYRELADRLIIQFLPEYEYSSTIIETQVGQLICKTTGSTPLRAGWKALTRDMEEEKDEDDGDAKSLPELTKGQVVGVADSETLTSTTKEPKHYKVDELLGDLESPGKYVENKELVKKIKKLQIGTDGTRQDHVNNLVPKGFVTHVKLPGKKKVIELHPTQKLIALMEIAPSYYKLPETSAYWEDTFVEIQEGRMTLGDFLAKQKRLLQRFFDDLDAGKFRFKEPTVSDYKICREKGCGGYLFFSELKKKSFNLWKCGKCKSAFFDKDGEPGDKMGAPRPKGKDGRPVDRPDWVPPKGTPSHKCTACDDGRAYHKKIEGKSWSLWECTGCKATFFDDKGKLGKQWEKKGK